VTLTFEAISQLSVLLDVEWQSRLEIGRHGFHSQLKSPRIIPGFSEINEDNPKGGVGRRLRAMPPFTSVTLSAKPTGIAKNLSRIFLPISRPFASKRGPSRQLRSLVAYGTKPILQLNTILIERIYVHLISAITISP
jgi:hypothetical protein